MTGTDVPPGYEICAIPDGEFATTNGPLLVCLTERGLRFKFRAENKQSVLMNASGGPDKTVDHCIRKNN